VRFPGPTSASNARELFCGYLGDSEGLLPVPSRSLPLNSASSDSPKEHFGKAFPARFWRLVR
jgi:hypothetical protein